VGLPSKGSTIKPIRGLVGVLGLPYPRGVPFRVSSGAHFVVPKAGGRGSLLGALHPLPSTPPFYAWALGALIRALHPIARDPHNEKFLQSLERPYF